jgi:hypothetical protein
LSSLLEPGAAEHIVRADQEQDNRTDVPNQRLAEYHAPGRQLSSRSAAASRNEVAVRITVATFVLAATLVAVLPTSIEASSDPSHDSGEWCASASIALQEVRVLLGLPIKLYETTDHAPRLLTMRTTPPRGSADSQVSAALRVIAQEVRGSFPPHGWQESLSACRRARPLWSRSSGDARADLVEVTALVQLAARAFSEAAPTIRVLADEVARFPSADPERLVRVYRLRELAMLVGPPARGSKSLWLGLGTLNRTKDALRDDLLLNILSRECLVTSRFLQRPVNPHGQFNAVDRLGRTPLHWAARCGLDEVVGQMLAYGAARGTRDLDQKTALDLARECGWTDVVLRLTSPAANPDQGTAVRTNAPARASMMTVIER